VNELPRLESHLFSSAPIKFISTKHNEPYVFEAKCDLEEKLHLMYKDLTAYLQKMGNTDTNDLNKRLCIYINNLNDLQRTISVTS